MKTIEDYLNHIYEEAEQKANVAKSDYQSGKNDCIIGVFDKWYRYNRPYGGLAYELGWVEQNRTTQNDKVDFLCGI